MIRGGPQRSKLSSLSVFSAQFPNPETLQRHPRATTQHREPTKPTENNKQCGKTAGLYRRTPGEFIVSKSVNQYNLLL